MPETDIEFDEIELSPTEFDALATVTKKLLARTGLPIEQIVMDELKKLMFVKKLNIWLMAMKRITSMMVHWQRKPLNLKRMKKSL